MGDHLPPRLDKGKGCAVDPVPVAGPSQPHLPLPALPNPKSKSLPVSNGPRYATQMPALFTEQNPWEEVLEESRRQADRLVLDASQHAKNNVMVYMWTKDDILPVIHDFQEGFKLPNFFFSCAVLLQLCMVDCDVQRYDWLLDTWVGFDTGHVVTVKDRDNHVLLVKSTDVTDCHDLDRHLEQLAHSGSPNLLEGLTDERKYN
ncbi:hypothetical protein HYDPIDRAFT_32225 [Hydnomerulius pinastri MD-312]|uniref:Uncharacterized protein n=1 Tax=Hydnomerulius pinastri MD-312 TaxID=994086 RepID=A0A0C9V4J0_9AGAM|nr:hypothetical protein HYDPIDRAFT_32225 [Hydnomerulius pinastri MD-312]